MNKVVQVTDGSREVFRFEGPETNFNHRIFKKWFDNHRFTTNKINIKMWCFASFMYGMAIRIYLS